MVNEQFPHAGGAAFFNARTTMLARCKDAGEPGRPAATAEPSSGGEFINGPRLDGDSGHASPCDIDAMFA